MEWTMVTVIISLVGLVVAIVKPLLSLNTSITKLTAVADALVRDMDKLTNKNSESHSRLWEHNKEQDDRLDDHETRLTVIERK